MISVVRVPSMLVLGTGRSWGEGWWTAADLALTHPVNDPMLPEPMRSIVLAMGRRVDEAYINGPRCGHRSPLNYESTRWAVCEETQGHAGAHGDGDGRRWTYHTMAHH